MARMTAARAAVEILKLEGVTSVFGVVPRLRPLGLEAQVIADNLIAIVNQRLVRQVCPFCSTEAPFTDAELAWLALEAGAVGRRGAGCDRCRDSGYYGRLPVYDVLIVDEALANGIADDIGREGIRALTYSRGFKNIETISKARVVAGQTTAEEVMRVVGVGPAP